MSGFLLVPGAPDLHNHFLQRKNPRKPALLELASGCCPERGPLRNTLRHRIVRAFSVRLRTVLMYAMIVSVSRNHLSSYARPFLEDLAELAPWTAELFRR